MFYVEEKVSRWGICPVSYRTLEDAEQAAARSMDCAEARVWDCSKSPVGTLVSVFRKGKKVSQS